MKRDDDKTFQVRTLDEAAIATHELYTAYLRAGFSKTEALALVIAGAATARAQVEKEDRA